MQIEFFYSLFHIPFYFIETEEDNFKEVIKLFFYRLELLVTSYLLRYLSGETPVAFTKNFPKTD